MAAVVRVTGQDKQECPPKVSCRMFDELLRQTPNFLQHTFVKGVQSEVFATEPESVKDDKDKVVIQVDFAENFTINIQNEIQSA